jgi:uncharacterized membrane protein YeaQ/YmgE (transglycosylase-associated protein family)
VTADRPDHTQGLDQPCYARPVDGVPQVFKEGSANLSWAMVAMLGLSPRPDGYSGNAAEQGHPQQVKGVAGGHHRCNHRRHHHRPAGQVRRAGDRDNIPLWLTVVCGIGGVLIGYYLAAALGVEATRGIDWTRWIISIIVAAVLVMIAASVTGRRGRAI